MKSAKQEALSVFKCTFQPGKNTQGGVKWRWCKCGLRRGDVAGKGLWCEQEPGREAWRSTFGSWVHPWLSDSTNAASPFIPLFQHRQRWDRSFILTQMFHGAWIWLLCPSQPHTGREEGSGMSYRPLHLQNGFGRNWKRRRKRSWLMNPSKIAKCDRRKEYAWELSSPEDTGDHRTGVLRHGWGFGQQVRLVK